MNWINQFVILFVFTCGLLVQSSSGFRSKLQPAEIFEFCVARNLSESSLFNGKDKVRISKIVMETDHRMHELRADPENPVNTKTMLRLFAAALACVVAEADSSVRPQREQACLTALEACAESLKEPSGAEIVLEMKKIFSAINHVTSTLDVISHNSVEVKKRERSEEERKEHPVRESEAKERPKRAAFRYQAFNTPLQSNPTLDSIIADKLLKSNTFKNFFTIGLSQEDAIFFSRSMVSSGLGGYRYDIIDEAMNAVTNAMYRLGSFSGSRDYAYAIGRSIAAVLSAHELTFFADGLGIGSSLVYQLDSMLGSNPSSTLPLSPSFGAVSVSSSGWGSSSAAASSQASGMASVQVNPGYVEPSFAVPPNPQNDKTQFQNRLAYSLSASEKISGTFCSGPFPGLYEVMNSAFADYGYQISSTIANVVSNSLNMLPVEAACTQYPEVISEIVADILDNNGFILVADPQAIANKISDLITSNVQSNPPQNPSGFGQQTSSGSGYQLNPSFSDYSYSAPEIPPLPLDQYPDSAISSSLPDAPVQPQGPVLTDSTIISSDASSPIIQTSRNQDFNLPAELSSDVEYSPDGSQQGRAQMNPTQFSSDASSPIIETSSRQDFNLPSELSSDIKYLPDGSPLSLDDSAAINSTWTIIDYPSDVLSTLDQSNQTSDSVDIAPPVLLEPGPVIPEKIPVDAGSESEPKMSYTKRPTTTPDTIVMTKVTEITTPIPLSTTFQPSTVMAVSEVTTPAPQGPLKDAFESPSKLSEFLLKEMKSSLKALNITSTDEEKQPNIPETPGNPTDVKITQTADSPLTSEDSKPVEKSSDSQEKPSSIQTSTEVQPSVETPQQQNRPPVDITLKAPQPITDEVQALVFAEKVSAIVTSAIRLIRSQNDLQFDELCNRLNELAPLVDLPPLDVCAEIPLIDYLLHVVNAVAGILAGEK